MITHEPRRQRYVIVVGSVRRLSTYGEGCTRAEALAFAVELAATLERKAAEALEARAAERDAEVDAATWRRAA